jgi:hypothetical protein
MTHLLYSVTHKAGRHRGYVWRSAHLPLVFFRRNLLKAFYDRNGRPPQRIVFYRDGVSDGQFEHVLAEEVTAIKKVRKSVTRAAQLIQYNASVSFVGCG